MAKLDLKYWERIKIGKTLNVFVTKHGYEDGAPAVVGVARVPLRDGSTNNLTH